MTATADVFAKCTRSVDPCAPALLMEAAAIDAVSDMPVFKKLFGQQQNRLCNTRLQATTCIHRHCWRRNNARLAQLLRGLGSYYYKEPTMLFLVRVAQGLVHMGKGLLTLNPYHTDNQLVSGDCPLLAATPFMMHYHDDNIYRVASRCCAPIRCIFT